MEQKQAAFEGWAIVEMMGHQREAGFVTTENYGAASLFRIDTPARPEREYILRRPEYAAKEPGTLQWAPVGSKVKRAPLPAKSRLVGVGSIYALNPCTEEACIAAIEELIRPDLILLELPSERQREFLLSSAEQAEQQEEDEEIRTEIST